MTGGAIGRNIERYVVWVGAGVIIRRMTTITGIRRIGVIAVVTSIAITGNGNMRSGKWINETMVEGRRRPGCFAMAGCAIGRELRSHMVGIGRLGVI